MDQVAEKSLFVEVYKNAKLNMATGEHHWNLQTRETADHSIPYAVAATLMDGTVSPRQFDEAHIWSPQLRALLRKIEVVANDEFTRAYDNWPVEHRPASPLTWPMANASSARLAAARATWPIRRREPKWKISSAA